MKSVTNIAADLFINEVLRWIKAKPGRKIEDYPIPPERMAGLAVLRHDGLLSAKQVKQIIMEKGSA